MKNQDTEPTEERVIKALAKLPFAVYWGKDRDGVIEITIPVKQEQTTEG